MNFKDNLKKIRKDNNLSQEELADKLGVSRQAVSKWESGAAYPEMDKVLQICKMFNLNIDDLLNKDIKEVADIKESKNIFNKYIDDFTSYITKTIDVFFSMKLKEKMKCIFEQIVLIGIFLIFFSIIGSVGENLIDHLFSVVPDDLYDILFGLIEGLYIFIAIAISIVLLVQIFKVRYLNYYDVVISSPKEEKEVTIEKEEKKIEKEKIIIRDPEHAGYRFIDGIAKIFILFIKFITIFIIFAFLLSLFAFSIVLILSFLICKSGLTFVGILLGIVSSIIINIIILTTLFNFIVNKKQKAKLYGLTFLISVILMGVGVGIFCIGFKEFEFIPFDYSNTQKDEYHFDMENNLYFDRIWTFDFHEENIKDIKIEVTKTKYENIALTKNGNFIDVSIDDLKPNLIMKEVIDDFNNKKIYYGNTKIDVYASHANIEIIKQNSKNKRY